MNLFCLLILIIASIVYLFLRPMHFLTLLNMASVNNLSDTADPKHQGLTFKSFETLMHELNQMSQELRSMEKENNNKQVTDKVENMRKLVKSFENIKM